MPERFIERDVHFDNAGGSAMAECAFLIRAAAGMGNLQFQGGKGRIFKPVLAREALHRLRPDHEVGVAQRGGRPRKGCIHPVADPCIDFIVDRKRGGEIDIPGMWLGW